MLFVFSFLFLFFISGVPSLKPLTLYMFVSMLVTRQVSLSSVPSHGELCYLPPAPGTLAFSRLFPCQGTCFLLPSLEQMASAQSQRSSDMFTVGFKLDNLTVAETGPSSTTSVLLAGNVFHNAIHH